MVSLLDNQPYIDSKFIENYVSTIVIGTFGTKVDNHEFYRDQYETIYYS